MSGIDEWLALSHILEAAVWTGAWFAICAFAIDSVRHPTPEAVKRLYAEMRSLGPTVIGPSTVLVLGAGIALVVRADWVAMADTWIITGFVLYVVVTLVGVLGLSRANRSAATALAADDLPAAGAATRTWL